MNKDNIELRSDKVRSIIGQIPPWIIRRGMSLIFIVFIVLLIGSYFFKYPYTVLAQVEFIKKDNSFIGIIEIPANDISKVEKGQEVEIYFEDIKNLNGLSFKSKINEISSNVTISKGSGFYTARIDKIESLSINENIRGIARIKTDEISFFDRIVKPFKKLKTE